MSTFGDRLYHMGGVPITNGGNPYLGLWGENFWFVDYDNGSDSNAGHKPEAAKKHLQTVLNDAEFGHGDVVYIRPRAPAQFDPNYIIPEGTSNWHIDSGDYGVALIGTGYGRGQGTQFFTYLRGTGTASATSALAIKAPWTLVENLSFHDGASTASCCVDIIGRNGTDGAIPGDGAGVAHANTMSNCMFRFSSKTSLTIESVMWATILDCSFHKGAGIQIYSSEQEPDGIEIGYCDWQAQTAEVDANIYIYGGVDKIAIHHNIFRNLLPTGGTNYYIYVHTASTGTIAGNLFGDDDATIGNLVSANGLTTAGNYSIDYAT